MCKAQLICFQMDFEFEWLGFINFYIWPRKIVGYPGSGSKSDLGGHFFIVRYRPHEQPALKPHDDNSIYSLNVALNTRGKDFEGGATRFIRYVDKTG